MKVPGCWRKMTLGGNGFSWKCLCGIYYLSSVWMRIPSISYYAMFLFCLLSWFSKKHTKWNDSTWWKWRNLGCVDCRQEMMFDFYLGKVLGTGPWLARWWDCYLAMTLIPYRISKGYNFNNTSCSFHKQSSLLIREVMRKCRP